MSKRELNAMDLFGYGLIIAAIAGGISGHCNYANTQPLRPDGNAWVADSTYIAPDSTLTRWLGYADPATVVNEYGNHCGNPRVSLWAVSLDDGETWILTKPVLYGCTHTRVWPWMRWEPVRGEYR